MAASKMGFAASKMKKITQNLRGASKMRMTIGASALRSGVGTKMQSMEMTSLDDLQAFENKFRHQIKMIQTAYDRQLKNLEPFYINAALKFVKEQMKIL